MLKPEHDNRAVWRALLLNVLAWLAVGALIAVVLTTCHGVKSSVKRTGPWNTIYRI